MSIKTIVAFFLLTMFSMTVVAQNEAIPFYGVTINSKDIFGSGKPFTLAKRKGGIKTTVIESAPVANELFEYLGAVYTTTDFSGIPSQLLNLSIDEYVPILDSIDFKYYTTVGLRLMSRTVKDNQEFETFKANFRAAPNNKVRKELVIGLSEDLRRQLEQTKYEIIGTPVSYDQAKSINRAFALGAGAKINAQIKKIVEIDASLSAAVQDSVSRIFKVENANYYQIALTETYMRTAAAVLAKAGDSPQLLSQSTDIYFAPAFERFLQNRNAAIIVQAAVIEASFDRSRTRRIESALKALLKGKVDPSKLTDKKIAELAAEVGGKYGKWRNDDKSVSASKAYYYIKYCANSSLELGDGARQ